MRLSSAGCLPIVWKRKSWIFGGGDDVAWTGGRRCDGRPKIDSGIWECFKTKGLRVGQKGLTGVDQKAGRRRNKGGGCGYKAIAVGKKKSGPCWESNPGHLQLCGPKASIVPLDYKAAEGKPTQEREQADVRAGDLADITRSISSLYTNPWSVSSSKEVRKCICFTYLSVLIHTIGVWKVSHKTRMTALLTWRRVEHRRRGAQGCYSQVRQEPVVSLTQRRSYAGILITPQGANILVARPQDPKAMQSPVV